MCKRDVDILALLYVFDDAHGTDVHSDVFLV